MSRRSQRQRYQQQKNNPVYQALMYSETPQAQSSPRNFKSFSKDGYHGNNTVYKCVSYIARNGAAIPPKLYTDATMQTEIKKHPLLDKLNKPNSEQTGVDYRESIIGFLLIAGNSYQYSIRNKNQPPDELWPMRPDYMEIMAAKPRGVTGYKFQTMSDPIDVANIGHLKYWCPDEDSLGMSPLEVAALEVDQVKAAKKWNLALLQNSGKQSGFWTTPAIMGKPERDRLEAKLNEKFAGAKNAGKMSVLDAGLTWQSMSLMPYQMDWLDMLKLNGGSIADIYCMPPQLVGDTSSTTYDNMEQAKQASYTEAIFPALDKMYALWNTWLVPMYPDLQNAYLYYDKTTVEVIQALLQAKLDAQSTRANNLWMSGLMMQDEARDLAGLPPVSGGQGKIFRIGAVLVPADQLMEYAEQSLTKPAAPPVPAAEPILPTPDLTQPGQPLQGQENAEKPNNDKPDDTEDNSNNSTPGTADRQSQKSHSARKVKALDLETSEQKQAYFKSVEAGRERWYDVAEQRLQDYFKQEKAAVLAAIHAAAIPASADVRVESAINNQSEDLKDILVKLYQDVSTDIGNETLNQLKSDSGHQTKGIIRSFLSLFGDSALKYLLTLAGMKIKQITATTLASVQLELSEGVVKGESIPELAKRIDGLYLQQIIPNRSTNIARTEVVGASNYASNEAASRSGLTLNKVYLATDDDRTRKDHADADGQMVAMNEPFIVGGYEMMYPGDSSRGAPADEICQCRCTQYYQRVKTDGASSEDDSSDDGQNDTGDEEKSYVPSQRKAKNDYRAFMEAVLK